MKFKWAYLAELIVGFVLLLYMGMHYQTNQNPLNEKNVLEYRSGWVLECAGEKQQPVTLPETIDNPTGATICLNHVLPEKATLDGDSIAFYTSHMNVKVYVEDVMVYSLTAPKQGPSKTPGNAWNIIDLKNQYRNKVFSVELTPAYQDVAGTIPQFMFGAKTDIIRDIIVSASFSLYLCMVILIIGMGIVVALLFLRKKMHFTRYVIWLGFFSVMLSLWSGGETQIFILLFGHNLFFNYLTFITLKLIFIPIMVFVRYLYNTSSNRVVDTLCVFSIIDFMVSMALQAFGIADLRETLSITHVIYCLGAFWGIFLTLRILIKGSGETRRKVMFHSICLLFVAMTVILDASFYYNDTSIDSARFSRLGLLIYILVLGYMVMRDSISLISVGRQAKLIREDARRDGLTEAYNRKAYEEAIEQITGERLKECAIMMFDLNNLKNVNDLYGHSMGDHYIMTVSQVLKDVYGTYGSIYRIGGDEFCVIAQDMSEALFHDLYLQVEAHMQHANERYLERRMSVACGYAAYDAGIDENVRDIVIRADRAMYQEKSRMKKMGI